MPRDQPPFYYSQYSTGTARWRGIVSERSLFSIVVRMPNGIARATHDNGRIAHGAIRPMRRAYAQCGPPPATPPSSVSLFGHGHGNQTPILIVFGCPFIVFGVIVARDMGREHTAVVTGIVI